VKQGDPLSPVIDWLFRAFPNEIGTKVGNVMTNAAALVDDLVLFAETRMGLQLLLDKTVTYLTTVGLTLNADKCFIIGMRVSRNRSVLC